MLEGLSEGSEGLSEGPEGLRGGDGRTYIRTYGISPHSKGLRPLSGPLPKNETNYELIYELIRRSAALSSAGIFRMIFFDSDGRV